MLEYYEDYQQKILAEIENLQGVAQERHMQQVDEKLRNAYLTFQNSRFLIAAFGGFSSGKSTFFNALTGKKLFPSYHTPTTASINYLQYGDEPKGSVRYKTSEEIQETRNSGVKELEALDTSFPQAGQEVSLDLEQLRQISRENEHSAYVREINIAYPSEGLKPEGVVWIDTPGTDSIIEYHKHVTYSLIDQADVILFFIYAPVPFKNSDWTFLEDIKNIREALKTDKFYFIVNAIDSLEDQSEEEVLRFIKHNLEKKAGIKEPKLIPVSSKLALYSKMGKEQGLAANEERELKRMIWNHVDPGDEISFSKCLDWSKFPELENVLSDFLTQNKAKVILLRAVERAMEGRKDMQRAMNLEKMSYSKSIRELDEMIENELMPDLEQKHQAIGEIIDQLESDLKAVDVNLTEAREEMDQLANNISKEEVNEFPKRAESVLQKHIYHEKKRIEQSISDRVAHYYPKILQVIQDFDVKLTDEVTLDFDPGEKLRTQMGNFDAARYLETVEEQSGSNYGGMDSDLALGGAAAGGLLAMLLPGGLGLLGGALLGGIAGGMASGGGVGGGYSIREVFRRDSFKQDISAQIKPTLDNVEQEMQRLLSEQREQSIEYLNQEFLRRIQSIKDEIKSLREKKQSIEYDKEAFTKVWEDHNERMKQAVATLKGIYDEVKKGLDQ